MASAGERRLENLRALAYAIDEAAKEYNLPKADLEAKASDPGLNSSRMSASEWAARHTITVMPKTGAQGLASSSKKLRELNTKLISQVAGLQDEVKDKVAQVQKLDENKMAQKIKGLEGEITSLKEEITSLKEENTSLKGEISSLKEENTSLKGEITSLKGEITSLKEENTILKGDITFLKTSMESMKQKLNGLRVVERVLMRKLLEAARDKCAVLLAEHVEIPRTGEGRVDWTTLIDIPRVTNLLKTRGLDDGLSYVRTIPRRLQVAAHARLESEEVYLQAVLDLPKNKFRSRMENILVFVFPATEEALAEELDDDDFRVE